MTEIHDLDYYINQIGREDAEQCNEAPDGHECHDGQLYSFGTRSIVGDCACKTRGQNAFLNQWKENQITRLKSVLLPRIDLAKTEPREWHKQLPESSGVWMSGKAGNGKTHAAGLIMARHIKSAKSPFQWSWFKARQIFEAWVNQYSDDYNTKSSAREIMSALKTHAIIVIDDLGITGNITTAREEHLYDMVENIYARGAILIVPANITIDAFCEKMANESMLLKRDGISPIQRRLKDICTQVKL